MLVLTGLLNDWVPALHSLVLLPSARTSSSALSKELGASFLEQKRCCYTNWLWHFARYCSEKKHSLSLPASATRLDVKPPVLLMSPPCFSSLIRPILSFREFGLLQVTDLSSWLGGDTAQWWQVTAWATRGHWFHLQHNHLILVQAGGRDGVFSSSDFILKNDMVI